MTRKLMPLIFLLALGTLLMGSRDFSCAATQTQMLAGLNAAVGVALDENINHLYFVEYNAPDLKRMLLTPECESDPAIICTVEVVATGFTHAEDVQLDIDHGLAYVTTRDDTGTTGVLWRVDIGTGGKSMVTFNLGAPQQLVLDIPNNQAYVVGYDDGRLRRINLTTGAKKPVFIGLDNPVGLAITGDGSYAYVSEQGPPARVSEIDLTTGTKVREVVRDGVSGVSLVAPFFLSWTGQGQNSLYVVERDPANRLARIDLIASAKDDVISGLPWRPSGITVSSFETPAFVTTDDEIIRVDLAEFDLTEPVFLGVGHVPSSEIVDGYATTDPLYFFKVTHAPFGGTLNFFGNLNNFKALLATHYEVLVSRDGGPYEALDLSWRAYKWNPDPTVAKYQPVTVAPQSGTTRYMIPDEYPAQAQWWYPPFLFMRWPSGENGLYTFQVRIYDYVGTDITWKLPAAQNSLTLRVDNTPPEINLSAICQSGSPGLPGNPCYPDKEVQPCDIVSSGANAYYFKVKAYDANQHLRYYRLKALWGDNASDVIEYHNYNGDPLHPAPVGHIDAEGLYKWSGVINAHIPSAPTLTWSAACNCAHTFDLWGGKRTINGYDYILHRRYHKSITINNTGSSCP